MKTIIIISLLVMVGSISTVLGFGTYGNQFMEINCDGDLSDWSMNSLHNDGWCSVVESQNRIIEQNDRLIELQEHQNKLLEQMIADKWWNDAVD